MTLPTVEQAPDSAPSSEHASTGPICDTLRQVVREASSQHDAYRAALRTLARHFDAPYAAIHVESASGTLDDYIRHGPSADGRWKTLCDGLLLDARYRDLPVARMYDSIEVGASFAAMAVPVREEAEGVVGSLVVVTLCDPSSLAAARLSELTALTALVADGLSPRRVAAPEDRASGQADPTGIAKVGGYGSVHEFAFTLVNGLKSKLGCDQVCLGRVRRRRVRLAAMSGLDDLYPRSPGARLIQQAMEECLDAGQPVVFQNESEATDETVSTGHLLHRRWHHETGNASVASLPLTVDGGCVAVLSLRNGPTRPLSRSDLERIEQVVSPLMPGFQLLEKAERHLPAHVADTVCAMVSPWLRPGAWGRKAVLATLLLLAAWVVFGTTRFVITTPCQVVPDTVRRIAAPFEGAIGAAYVEPGESVEAGQLLIEMDTKELVLEHQKYGADLKIAELDLARALAAKDLASASQASSRIEIADSQLDLVKTRIARSRIRAPTAGVVLSGDVLPRIGEVVPLGEPLIELAPHDDWSLEIDVPEGSAEHVDAGQTGQFTTNSRPDLAQACTVRQVDLVSKVVDGTNVFVVEADVTDRPEWIRVGMTGIARIDAGRHPVWWVALHRVLDTIRLQMWKL